MATASTRSSAARPSIRIGRTSTLTAPSGDAQEALLRDLLERGRVDAASVGYVEAHGTGTPVGDPTEARAIGRVLGKTREGNATPVGSVKPNIGHLKSAAEISGFIKAVLSVYHGQIAPNRNFESGNPAIPFEALNIRVPVEAENFPATNGRRFAVVNSFGFGGTNASALIEDAGEASHRDAFVRPQVISDRLVAVPVSASDEAGLKRVAAKLAAALRDRPELASADLGSVAATLAECRDHLHERAVFLSKTRDELVDNLEAYGNGGGVPAPEKRDAIPALVHGRSKKRTKLVFTYAGQGSQWAGMGRRLLLEDRPYRDAIEEFDAYFKRESGWSIVDEMLVPEAESRIHNSEVTQPAIFANQMGLTAAWAKRGVKPDLILGHSLGEIAAAYAAGAIDLAGAARIIHRRSLLRRRLGVEGAMAAVGLSREQIIPYLPADGTVEIGAFNGPTMLTLTGTPDGIDQILSEITTREPNAFARRLKTDFSWHSFQLEPAAEWFLSEIRDVHWHAPRVPFISTATGRLETCLDSVYWWRNLRLPVQYEGAVGVALALGADGFLEIGPHRTVTPLTSGVAADKGAASVPLAFSLHREQDDFDSLAHAASVLHVSGHHVDLDEVIGGAPQRDLPLPKYPWAKLSLWTSQRKRATGSSSRRLIRFSAGAPAVRTCAGEASLT